MSSNLGDVLRKLKSGMEIVHRDIADGYMARAQAYTPVKTGNLKQSWRVDTNNQSLSEIKNDAHYAVYVHNGTERQRSNPYAINAARDIDYILQKAFGKIKY